MSILASDHFDLFDFIKKSKELGVPELVAEFQGRQIEHVIEIAVNTIKHDLHNKDLATKKDIKDVELKIEQAKNQLIIWVTGLMVVNGILTHFLK